MVNKQQIQELIDKYKKITKDIMNIITTADRDYEKQLSVEYQVYTLIIRDLKQLLLKEAKK